ncbi:SH3 domain-containing protein [Bauldia sp.]|uniref:SH3 domain-containing protein n=1 Tax=Bauldia sp. TaxID=2575872 RepID=UPI003BA94A60
MNFIRTGIIAMIATVAVIVAPLPSANAAAFYAWSIIDVPPGDTLNVRAWPSNQSQILVAYPNTTVLSMTGKCTGGVSLDHIAGWPAWKQRQAVRYQWCETWVDPYSTGEYRTAWIYGKYIEPA